MQSMLIITTGVGSALLLALAGFMVATWAPDLTVTELTPRWGQPPSQFLEVAGLRLHVRDEGPRSDQTPIVLMHGAGASLHVWDGWTAVLRGTRRVIRYDLAGYGLTGPAPGG